MHLSDFTVLEYGFAAFCFIGSLYWLLSRFHSTRNCRKEHPICTSSFWYCFKDCEKKYNLTAEEIQELKRKIVEEEFD